ncbi:hypothetical protein DPMN_154842 [Dreissena polymorpha]|uniref:Uncharacterized protein n=1 Tax=Dreissena polymorpha TaxID=45954 RepID=A0A9D4FRL5_DREPO|nr:hypothetical protein DPMN_154842 [Dreissena polymorpha]
MKRTNAVTYLHDDLTINVSSRVLTRKTAPYHKNTCSDNLDDDWTIHVTSRVLTRLYYSRIRKTAPPPGGHVFQTSKTIFELSCKNIKTNIMTKFNEDWTIIVTSRVLTTKKAG